MKLQRARDIMNRNVISVPEDLPVGELGNLFTEHGISGAPVVDEDGRIVGVVSLTDIVRANAQHQLLAEAHEPPDYYFDWDDMFDHDREVSIVVPDDLLVRNIMTPTVFGVPEDMTLPEMADTMIRGRIHRLIVMTGDRVVGIITSLDMLKAIRAMAGAPTTTY